MLGNDWKLTEWQREVITRWFDLQAVNLPATSLTHNGTVGTPASTKRGTRLPEDWWPSSDVQRELTTQYPGLDFSMILAEFRDYWCAVPGQRGLKLSWDRTFRNRVREVAHKPQYHYHLRGQGANRAMSKVDTKAMGYLED